MYSNTLKYEPLVSLGSKEDAQLIKAKMENRVMILEDDYDIACLLERTFQQEGFKTTHFAGGIDYNERIRAFEPDLVLLDLMLPEVDGLSVCRSIKQVSRHRDVKVIMLTAKSDESDILHGYDSGADDYVTKPFSPREVVARAKAVLRRKRPSVFSDKSQLISRERLTIDDDRYEISISGEPLDLTHSEYRILRVLAIHPKRVYTRQQLAESVINDDTRNTKITGNRNIDVHIQALRKKLGECSSYIRTIRGVGYSFNPEKL